MTRRISRLLFALVLVAASAFAQRGAPIGIYDVGETVGWTVTPAAAPPACEKSYFLAIYLRASRALAIDSEHDHLTPAKGRPCPARTSAILGGLVRGGTFAPPALAR